MTKGLRPLAAIALLTAAGLVAAQGYPNKPVTVVVPFTAGGPTDTVARSLGQAMSKSLGQSVVVENVGGAGGTVGATRVKNAAPDGYTVLLHHIGMSTAPALYRKLAYNPQTDFEMIGLIVDVPMTMIAPDASVGKRKRFAIVSRTRRCDLVTAAHHGFVNGIIILPNSGQPRAKLECEFSIVASGPGLSLTPDISAPSPPEFGADRAR